MVETQCAVGKRAVAFALVALLTVAIGAACRGGSDGPRSATGVIIDVQATSLTDIVAFTLHGDDGKTYVFHVAPDAARDPQEGFFPGHLRSHAVAAERVRVFYRANGDELLAYKLEHASS